MITSNRGAQKKYHWSDAPRAPLDEVRETKNEMIAAIRNGTLHPRLTFLTQKERDDLVKLVSMRMDTLMEITDEHDSLTPVRNLLRR